jgi:hypothetical protein
LSMNAVQVVTIGIVHIQINLEFTV